MKIGSTVIPLWNNSTGEFHRSYSRLSLRSYSNTAATISSGIVCRKSFWKSLPEASERASQKLLKELPRIFWMSFPEASIYRRSCWSRLPYWSCFQYIRNGYIMVGSASKIFETDQEELLMIEKDSEVRDHDHFVQSLSIQHSIDNDHINFIEFLVLTLIV